MRLKNPFTYIGTKNRKNSHPKRKFFQKSFSKKLRAAKKQLSRSGYSVIFSVIIGRWTIFPLPPAAEGRMQAQAMPYSSGNCIPPVWRASPAKCAGKLRSPPSRTPTHKRPAAWYRTAADTASSRARRGQSSRRSTAAGNTPACGFSGRRYPKEARR